MREQDQREWIYEQFGLIYWNYRSFTKDNLVYLLALPETASVSDCGEVIHLAHVSNVFYRSPTIMPFCNAGFRSMMQSAPFSHEQYLVYAREALLSRADALEELNGLAKGVYLFGHNHLQFYMEYGGRLFINPGSCGCAVDDDTRAAYTLFMRKSDGWLVDERRVDYDTDAVVMGLRRSGLAAQAPVWSQVIERQFLSGKDYMLTFVTHLEETARKHGQTDFPVSNDVWDIAVKAWDANGYGM